MRAGSRCPPGQACSPDSSPRCSLYSIAPSAYVIVMSGVSHMCVGVCKCFTFCAWLHRALCAKQAMRCANAVGLTARVVRRGYLLQDLRTGGRAGPGSGLPCRRERQCARAGPALHRAEGRAARLPGPSGRRPLLVSVRRPGDATNSLNMLFCVSCACVRCSMVSLLADYYQAWAVQASLTVWYVCHIARLHNLSCAHV